MIDHGSMIIDEPRIGRISKIAMPSAFQSLISLAVTYLDDLMVSWIDKPEMLGLAADSSISDIGNLALTPIFNPVSELTEKLRGQSAVTDVAALADEVFAQLEKARALLKGTKPGSRVTLMVGRGKTSQMAGQHRENIRRIKEEFSLAELKIREKSEADTEITLLSIEK